jgi:hypothetical protein
MKYGHGKKRGKTEFVANLEPGEWPALRTAMCLAVGQGTKVPAVAEEYGCDVATVTYALRSMKHIQIRERESLAEVNDESWRSELASRSAGNLLRHARQVNEQEEVTYNDAKVFQGNLKGLGHFKVGDSAVFNQQNNFVNVTEEQAVRILNLGRSALAPATIIEATTESAPDNGAAEHSDPDQGRSAVVAEERDQDH